MKTYRLRYGTLAALLLSANALSGTESAPSANLSAIHGKVPFLTLLPSQMYNSRSPVHPFLSSSLPVPPKSDYDGNLFELRHDYPSAVAPGGGFPWQKVTGNGPITKQNAMALSPLAPVRLHFESLA